MGEQRVFLQKGKQRQLLELSKNLSRLTWEDFAPKIGVSSYSVLRATYLNERNSLPTRVLNQVAQYLTDEDWKSWIICFRDEHWGQAKGGSVSLKAWHSRMRQNSRSYLELQSSRFRTSRNYKYTTSAGYEVRSSYELLVAENLIVNQVPHQYERMVRCGEHILFPDFFISGDSGKALLEICGFRSGENWKRLCEKLYIYASHGVADILIVAYLRADGSFATAARDRFGDLVQFVAVDDMRGLLSMLERSHRALTSFRIVTQSEALGRCQQVDGKRIHWQRLLMTMPKGSWIETLVTCGLPEFELERVRRIEPVRTRLIEATRLALKSGLVAREALVEMIAGTCNGSAGDHFGSMGNLIAVADFPILEKLR